MQLDVVRAYESTLAQGRDSTATEIFFRDFIRSLGLPISSDVKIVPCHEQGDIAFLSAALVPKWYVQPQARIDTTAPDWKKGIFYFGDVLFRNECWSWGAGLNPDLWNYLCTSDGTTEKNFSLFHKKYISTAFQEECKVVQDVFFQSLRFEVTNGSPGGDYDIRTEWWFNGIKIIVK